MFAKHQPTTPAQKWHLSGDRWQSKFSAFRPLGGLLHFLLSNTPTDHTRMKMAPVRRQMAIKI
jgi:hypothetical protein